MAHMHYKGTGRVHSFKGILTNGAQRKIRIQGPVGAIAWRITKFQLMGKTPGAVAREHVAKVTREELSSIDGVVNFDDDELLAVGIWLASDNILYGTVSHDVIFDNALFSRNIFVSQSDVSGGANSCNYYIELEEVKVSKAGMAQLAVAAARRTID